MKLLHPNLERASSPSLKRRGAALLLSLLVLFVLVAIVFQLSIGTNTDARVGRNDVQITTMEMAIESALLEVEQQLITDAEGSDEAGAGDELGGDAADPGLDPEDGAEDPAGEGAAAEGPTDSKEDAILKPQRTEINGIQLRILIQDEDGKFNVLALADPDEALADEAEERLTRIIDLAREDTGADISTSDAEEMARDMREFLMRRNSSDLARPSLITDDEAREDVGMPLSLREFGVLESFPENAFREFRDEDGVIVHSLEAYLTVYSALTTGINLINARAADSNQAATDESQQGNVTEGDDGEITATGGDGSATSEIGSNGGGYTININTAPPAVLKGFFDPSVVDARFWDLVIEYRNFEEEEEEGSEEDSEEEEDQFDEYGNRIYKRQIFDSIDELNEIEDFENMDDERKEALSSRLRVASDVFTVTIAAMRSTAVGGDDMNAGFIDPDRREDDERQAGKSLIRVVRAVYWRRSDGDEVTVVPLVRWEVLDYVPYEVTDFPEGEDGL